MSNPMLAGLGIKATDPKFKLPEIKTSDGKGSYTPSAPKDKVAEQQAAARAALLAGEDPDKPKGLEPTAGLVFGMAAAIVSANHEHATAAEFWRQAGKDMKLENTLKKDEWAEWALENAEIQERTEASRRALPPPDQTMHEDHPTLLKTDVERYRRAGEWAKGERKKQKDEEAKPPEKQKTAATVEGSGHESKIQAVKVDSNVFADEEEEDEGRKNKNYWKKDDDKKKDKKEKKKKKKRDSESDQKDEGGQMKKKDGNGSSKEAKKDEKPTEAKAPAAPKRERKKKERAPLL